MQRILLDDSILLDKCYFHIYLTLVPRVCCPIQLAHMGLPRFEHDLMCKHEGLVSTWMRGRDLKHLSCQIAFYHNIKLAPWLRFVIPTIGQA